MQNLTPNVVTSQLLQLQEQRIHYDIVGLTFNYYYMKIGNNKRQVDQIT